MALQWRQWTETAKQKWGLSIEKNFKATTNARNEAMFREATMFANHLRTVEKDLTAWQRSIETSYTNFRSIMLSPLPRVYEEGHNGQAVPSEAEPSQIGGTVQVERLISAAVETKKRLDTEVLQPIKQWMAAYRTIQDRMKRLEALRLETDSRRRTVADLQGKCERVRATLGTTRGRGEIDMEMTIRKMQHKEDKMHRFKQQFEEMEQTVYNSLFTLIKDTSVLRDYIAAAILIIQDCFQAAHASFEPQIPQFSTTSAVQVSAYGQPQAAEPQALLENKYSAPDYAASDKYAPGEAYAAVEKYAPADKYVAAEPQGGGDSRWAAKPGIAPVVHDGDVEVLKDSPKVNRQAYAYADNPEPYAGTQSQRYYASAAAH